jgi:hypothetical protein
MATFNWTALSNGQVIAFDPLLDVFSFDDPAISAADVIGNATPAGTFVSYGGKTVLILAIPERATGQPVVCKRDGLCHSCAAAMKNCRAPMSREMAERPLPFYHIIMKLHGILLRARYESPSMLAISNQVTSSMIMGWRLTARSHIIGPLRELACFGGQWSGFA